MLKLRERLAVDPAENARVVELPVKDTTVQDSLAYQQMKARVHQLLLGRLDLVAVESMAPERLRGELSLLVERLLIEENVVVNATERRNLVRTSSTRCWVSARSSRSSSIPRSPTSW